MKAILSAEEKEKAYTSQLCDPYSQTITNICKRFNELTSISSPISMSWGELVAKNCFLKQYTNYHLYEPHY